MNKPADVFACVFLLDNNECASDVNLCGSRGVCQNTPGSFTCECQRGFALDQTGASCEGTPVRLKQSAAL